MKTSTIVFEILKRVHLRSLQGSHYEQSTNVDISFALMNLHKNLEAKGE